MGDQRCQPVGLPVSPSITVQGLLGASTLPGFRDAVGNKMDSAPALVELLLWGVRGDGAQGKEGQSIICL